MLNEQCGRQASLQLTNSPNGQVLKAKMPVDANEKDLLTVGSAAFGLISRLTGCNCLSGRISFVVEDNFADVIRVELPEAARLKTAV